MSSDQQLIEKAREGEMISEVVDIALHLSTEASSRLSGREKNALLVLATHLPLFQTHLSLAVTALAEIVKRCRSCGHTNTDHNSSRGECMVREATLCWCDTFKQNDIAAQALANIKGER